MATKKSTAAGPAETTATEQVAEQPQPTAKAKPAEKKPAARPAKAKKYDEATIAITRRAQSLRGRKNAIASVTVTRVQKALADAGLTADDVVKMFPSIKAATAFAGRRRGRPVAGQAQGARQDHRGPVRSWARLRCDGARDARGEDQVAPGRTLEARRAVTLRVAALRRSKGAFCGTPARSWQFHHAQRGQAASDQTCGRS
jgi:hypothetical protein